MFDLIARISWKARLRSRFLRVRQRVANAVLSALYRQPMQVLPQGHVGLAGAVLFWYMQDGQRQFIMLRHTANGDERARFVSCLGTGNSADMSAALKKVVKAQMGAVFTRALGGDVLNPDRVVGAPLFNYTDEQLGLSTPVQSLVWVVHISHHLADLVVTTKDIQAVMVPEFAMTSDKVSPTHRALWSAVQRHLPKMRSKAEPSAEAVEEAIKVFGGTPRLLN